MPVEDEVSELYALPLDEFTAARNSLATRLAKGGDKSAAAEVKALRTPSLPAWADNHPVRERPDDIQTLSELRAELEGASGATAIRAATDRRKKLIAGLVAEAAEILEAAGHSASSSHLEAISQTIQAAVTDEEERLLLEGRLTKELTPSGFGAWGALGGEPEEESSPGVDEQAEVRARLNEARDRCGGGRVRRRSGRSRSRGSRGQCRRSEAPPMPQTGPPPKQDARRKPRGKKSDA